MAKPEWGSKRVCQSCGAKFYDLNRNPIHCPSCEARFDPEVLPRVRRSRPAPPKPVKPVKAAAAESDEASEDALADDDLDVEVEDAGDDDLIVDTDASDDDDDVGIKVNGDKETD